MSVKSLRKAVEKKKTQLINKAIKRGLYENFGEKEQRYLKDKFIDLSSYTDEMNKKRDIVQSFNEWCYNFNDKQLQEYQDNDDSFSPR